MTRPLTLLFAVLLLAGPAVGAELDSTLIAAVYVLDSGPD